MSRASHPRHGGTLTNAMDLTEWHRDQEAGTGNGRSTSTRSRPARKVGDDRLALVESARGETQEGAEELSVSSAALSEREIERCLTHLLQSVRSRACAICLEASEVTEWRTLPCGHKFCNKVRSHQSSLTADLALRSASIGGRRRSPRVLCVAPIPSQGSQRRHSLIGQIHVLLSRPRFCRLRASCSAPPTQCTCGVSAGAAW